MVFIHPGGFVGGSAGEDAYDGGRMATKGVTVVSFNYRVGAFGFATHPSIGANFGLLDQQEALAWIRRNIRRFGGNQRNITLYGASSGAVSARWLMATPPSTWNFNRVILQSGGFDAPLSLAPCISYRKAQKYTELLFDKLGTRDPTVLRRMPMRAVLAASHSIYMEKCGNTAITIPQAFVWAPVFDGVTFVSTSLDHVPQYVPLLLGCAVSETQYSFRPGRFPSREDLETWINHHCGASSQKVLDCLRSYKGGDNDFAERFATTLFFFEPCMATAYNYHYKGGRTVYVYHFAKGRQTMPGGREGASHTRDIPYVFENLPRLTDVYQWDVEDGQIANKMQSAWVAFARSGEPRCREVGDWRPFPYATKSFGSDLPADADMVLGELVQILLIERRNRLFGPNPAENPGLETLQEEPDEEMDDQEMFDESMFSEDPMFPEDPTFFEDAMFSEDPMFSEDSMQLG
ncbi:hypothetical protein PRZ48_014851 [Zasmidium cellare]|uniref:Carboxylic ester hydrolase n=1 Tax=Zasmidium cellare TaxID=395010 RepID=A0ABR0DWV6_ZASCE|nr:hypothetical protein PRZ48_014851 [Zasmidium cellare]